MLPGADDFGQPGEWMAHYGVQTRHDGQVLGFDDPWGKRIRVRTA